MDKEVGRLQHVKGWHEQTRDPRIVGSGHAPSCIAPSADRIRSALDGLGLSLALILAAAFLVHFRDWDFGPLSMLGLGFVAIAILINVTAASIVVLQLSWNGIRERLWPDRNDGTASGRACTDP